MCTGDACIPSNTNTTYLWDAILVHSAINFFIRPVLLTVWLGAPFLSAVAVSLRLNCIVLTSAVVLSLIWHVPVRAGLVFVAVDTFTASVGIIAYLALLAWLVHPAIAVTFALIFNADLFYSVDLWTQSAIRSGNSRLFWIRAGLISILLPVSPFRSPERKIHLGL